jgi:hypothetical protein
MVSMHTGSFPDRQISKERTMSIRSPYPDVEAPEIALHGFVRDRADRRGAAVPLMGHADPGTVVPLMGPADPGTVTSLMGPADPGTVTSLMGPADPGTVLPLMGPADSGTATHLMSPGR